MDVIPLSELIAKGHADCVGLEKLRQLPHPIFGTLKRPKAAVGGFLMKVKLDQPVTSGHLPGQFSWNLNNLGVKHIGFGIKALRFFGHILRTITVPALRQILSVHLGIPFVYSIGISETVSGAKVLVTFAGGAIDMLSPFFSP